MGIGIYFLAVNLSKDGIAGTGILGPVSLALLVGFKLGFAIRNRLTIGRFINPEDSNIINPDGSLKWVNLVPLLGNAYANISHIFLFTYAFKFAKMGGLNQGVVPIVTTTATLYNSVIFYFVFGEKVSKVKIFGMLFTVGCVVLLALDSSQKKAAKMGEVQTEPKYALYGLGLALIVPVNFSFKHFLIKKYKAGYDYLLAFDSAILENVACTIFIFFYVRETGGFYSQNKVIFGSLSGLLQTAGRIFIALAVSEG